MLKRVAATFTKCDDDGSKVVVNFEFAADTIGEKGVVITMKQMAWISMANFLSTGDVKVGVKYCGMYYNLVTCRAVPLCEMCVAQDPEQSHHEYPGGCLYSNRNNYEIVWKQNVVRDMKKLYIAHYDA